MEQHISLENIDPLKVKALFRKLCIVGNGYAKKEHYIHDLGIQPKKYGGPYTSAERALMAKIQQLEQELQQTRKEKDKALIENRKKVNELNIELLSIKTKIKELIHYKQERDRKLRNLEKKIIKTVK
jgi:hypothetical protein